tara:strand:- start:200 stop:766 length:567 start_codon:yes stop_codon:yes gene_type:complete
MYNLTMISRLISFLLLIMLSPFLLIISLIIYIDDGFPVFFRQKRVGINNAMFWLYKFRTMKKDTPDIPTHLVKNPEFLYIRFGSLLRKFSIDELPQLINIIKGEMVFVGPRPALHNQDDLVKLRTKVGIHKLMPGVTGWSQVNGRDTLSINEKVKFDTYYLENKSFWLNINILFMTGVQVIFHKGISH